MRVCITGATGFIGSRMALHFVAQGHDVVVLALANNEHERSNQQMLESNGVDVVIGDVTQLDKIKACVEGVDWLFHLAAAQHEAGVPDEYFRRINVDGTKAVLDAAVAVGVKRFVYGSTIGVYGHAMDGELDEESQVDPANIYGVTKLEAERLVLSYKNRLPVTAIRISETYGPGDRRLLKLFKGIQKGRFFIMGGGQNIHQLIYVDDLIRGMEYAAASEDAIAEVFVLAGSEKLTTKDMCMAVGPCVSKTGRVLRVPLWPFMLVAFCLELICRPLGVQPPIHRRRLDFFRKSFFFRNNKAKSMLGFEAGVGFSEGVHRTADWYRDQGML